MRVPELDWSTPGVPTVKARKSKKVASNATLIDVWFFRFYVGANGGVLPEVAKPAYRVPNAPDDDPPRLWQYVTPMLKFERVCLRKGIYLDDGGDARNAHIMMVRWNALIYTLWMIGSWILPIPRYIRKAWRAYKRSKRPLRKHRRNVRNDQRER